MAFFLRRKKSDTRTRASHSRFHAVTVRPGRIACSAVRARGSTRYLSSEAPPLPLPECTVASCTCRYLHFDDRRGGEDRRDAYRPRVDHPQPRAPRDRRHAEATARA